jgi:23S rRNA G2069 N7-methylase RlmK/C1962 C5-methylase RlmI
MVSPGDAARATMLHNRLRKVARHRRKWARRAGVTCYRLYDRDIPEIPLVVDWYDGRLHVSDASREDEAIGLEALLDAAARALDVPTEQVYCKRRQRQRGAAQYTPFDRAEARFVVSEGGHRFWVNLSDYLDTGLFLDHRRTRARVQAEATGARMLNLFAYTGSFTVYAAAGGARHTMTVDLSATYLDWAQANLALNNLAGPQHQFERGDVLQWMQAARSRPARYDLIVLDPPTFSNSKRMRTTFDVRRDHPRLIADARALLTPTGALYFSTNARRFRLDAAISAEEITDIPPDFERRRPHRCWKITR